MANAALHRENLVRTAMRLFRRQGYASTGLQQILSDSGAPKGSLYHYFPSGKEELGEAAITMAGDMIGDMLRELAERHEDPKVFVSSYCKTMAGWMKDSDFRSGCPIATTLLETAPQSPPMTQKGKEIIDHWTAIIAGVFERAGIQRTKAKSDAQQLIATMEGALILARVYQSTKPILNIAKTY